MKNPQVLKEIIVKADEESLNSAIAEKHIAPESIVSVMLQPGMPTLPGDQDTPRDQLFAIAGLEAGSVFKG
jgi:hypothetical protein